MELREVSDGAFMDELYKLAERKRRKRAISEKDFANFMGRMLRVMVGVRSPKNIRSGAMMARAVRRIVYLLKPEGKRPDSGAY